MTNGEIVRRWDVEAETFDDEPHHALEDPTMRGAWWDVLEEVLPLPPSRIADLGCGTGSLAVLLAERGHEVLGLDVSPRMIERAQAKAARVGVDAVFVVGDAALPPLMEASVDVVITRHVLWALKDLASVLDRWLALLAPQGRLVLIEGRWHTGFGIVSEELVGLVARPGVTVDVLDLEDPLLWGHPLTDSRYALVART
jgi:SAM-dependent methyltransferase